MTEPVRSPRYLEPESEIVRVLAEAGSVAEAAHDVLAALAVWLQWDVALFWVPDDEVELLRCGPSWSADDEALLEFRRVSDRLTFARGVGLPGRAWSSAHPLWIEDLEEEDRLPRAGVAAEAGLRSALALPVLGAGSVLGVIELFSRELRSAEPQHEQTLRTSGTQLAHFAARVRAEERLRHTEERTAAIVEAALDCIVTMDHQGFVVDLNAAAEDTFGYSREDAVGRPLAELIMPPELRAAHRAGLERYLATRESRILNRRLELEAMRADGSTFPVELTVIRAGELEPPLFAGFLRDITTRRDAESERRRLLKHAVASRASEEAARLRVEIAQREAEIERRRLEFLAYVGFRMAASMDYAATLEDVAREAIPDLADLCVVTVVAPDGRPQSIAVAHADHECEAVLRELSLRSPHASLPGAATAMRTGEYELLAEVGDGALVAAAGDDEILPLLRRLGLRSLLSVPMKSSARVLGTITLGFGESDRRFASADLVVGTALAARAGLHLENARLYTERSEIAHTLQQSLLPAELPAIPGLEVAAYYRAAGDQNQVGGDFYDVFQTESGIWNAIIGDVSGKGAEAAALTALTRHTLYAAALRETSPARNLAFLDEVMRKRRRGAASFSTVLYVRVCPGAGSTALTLASGGHPPGLILRADGSVEQVETPGTLVGVLEHARFEDRDARLSPGDLLLLCTDGAIELRRRDITFGERQVEQVLREHIGASAQEVVDAVATRVDELQDGSPRDDVALLALRMAPHA